MNEKIQKKLKELPNKSGVYIMHDINGDIIYVGKAKNLKKRVSSYFNHSQKTPKVWAMVEKIDWFEYIITPNELDAFALENNLIKKEQPFYNILLKDSKTFPYIKLDSSSNYPRFSVVRKVLKDGAKYFGPYLAGVSANAILDFLNKFFKLRTCKKSLQKPQKRECLNYQLGLCSAPCTGKISETEYNKNILDAINFLNGNDEEVVKKLNTQMQNFAETENFEQAIEVRKILNMITKLRSHSIANLPKNVNKDVVCYFSNEVTSAIAVLIVRNGRILGVQSFSIIDPSITEAEVLENFMLSYYENAIIPNEIIINFPLEDELFLQEVFSKKIKFITNPKGVNLRLLKMAEENAKEHIEKNLTKDRQKYDNTIGAIKALKEKLKLNSVPKRIECYDISHISGTNSVASMVVFKNGEAKKSDYRKMKIKSFVGNDDFKSLKEVLTRRILRFLNQDGESFKEKPDLLIIDGGKGQLSSCLEILKQFKLDDKIEIISLAKKLEEVFVADKEEGIKLDHNTAPLKLLQRARDEAHRFAITFHRKTRTKNMFSSALDEIVGIGPKKRKQLLDAFNDVETIKKLNVDELKEVNGITTSDAINIYNFFHK
ncbi:MAG: excinuclease ABC subunit UvrC [Clostridia bacterium]|nr:excinuclease ABC subunit UvrC [Clostridia bacterium]